MNVDDVRKDFAVESFFFVATAAYSQLFCEFFSLTNYIMLTSSDESFRQQFSVAESCMRGSLFMQFLSTTIS